MISTERLWIQDTLPGMQFLCDSDRCPWCPEVEEKPVMAFDACRCEELCD